MSIHERDGVLVSMLPRDLELPMVAPQDLGTVAARLLQEPAVGAQIHYAEGPERYTPAAVAGALAEALDRTVEVKTIARDRWEQAFRSMGFSEKAARSYACMTGVTVDEPALPEAPIRGEISLVDYMSGAAR